MPQSPENNTQKTIHLVSLGCPRNLVESERLLGALAQQGYVAEPRAEKARTIVINTCGFVEDAVEESIDAILECAQHKETGHCERLVVCGCLVQRYGGQLADQLPEVDHFIGTGGLARVAQVLEKEDSPECLLPDPGLAPLQGPSEGRMRTTPHISYLKIAEGCPEKCTFCVIPKLWGPLRSRPAEHVVSEARSLWENGAREIILVGQETTAYGLDTGKTDLAGLLEKLCKALPRARFRFLYGHPARVTDRLLDAVRQLPLVHPYFDVPIQHASDRILKKMGRHYQGRDVEAMVARIRQKVPEAILRTTLLVGFPGEEKSDYLALKKCVQSLKFDHLGVFVYSDADDLASHKLPGHVLPRTAKRRRDRLMEIQAKISLEKNLKRMGSEFEVLVTGPSDDSRFPWLGLPFFQAPEIDGKTLVRGQGLTPGTRARVRALSGTVYDIYAEALQD